MSQGRLELRYQRLLPWRLRRSTHFLRSVSSPQTQFLFTYRFGIKSFYVQILFTTCILFLFVFFSFSAPSYYISSLCWWLEKIPHYEQYEIASNCVRVKCILGYQLDRNNKTYVSSSGFLGGEGGFPAVRVSVWSHNDRPIRRNQTVNLWTLHG